MSTVQKDVHYYRNHSHVKSGVSSPLVSVIIPVYNGSDYVREAIDSVLAQTFSDYEIMVVDDGSTDMTPEIVQAYTDGRIRYVRQDNQGVAAALNRGISEAQGKYIAWLSHDDLFLPQKLERQVEFLRQFPQYTACYSDYYVIDPQGKILWERRMPWYPRQQALQVLFGEAYINGCTMLIERGCFEKVGLFNEHLTYTQDTEMWIRLMMAFEIGRVPEKLVKQRTHPAQGSQQHLDIQEIEALAMYKDLFDRVGMSRIIFEGEETDENPCISARGYEWLGTRMAVMRGAYDFADEQFRRSVELWPSWRNPARWKLLLGAKRSLGWKRWGLLLKGGFPAGIRLIRRTLAAFIPGKA